jgi:peroxiredoxin
MTGLANGLLIAGRLVLIAVFVLAGVGKLADRPGSARALAAFGIPKRAVTPVTYLLPLAELATAAALFPTTSASFGALAALVLLAAFTAAITVNLARGNTPDCHCFGQLGAGPIGTGTLVRNGALAMVAAAVIGMGARNPQPSFADALSRPTPAEWVGVAVGLLLLAIVAIQGWFLLQLLSQQGRILLRLEKVEAALGIDASAAFAPGLAIGSPAPKFELPDLLGERVTLQALLARGRPVLLIFSDPDCAPCSALLPEIAGWQREFETTLAVAVVSRGSVEINHAKVSGHQLHSVLLQQRYEVAEAYRFPGTPSAVLITADGHIASSVVAGADGVRSLLQTAVHGEPGLFPLKVAAAPGNGNGHLHAHLPGPPIGAPAPPLTLPDLDGATVSLDGFRGRDTLVLFWNPGCGFCQQILDRLKTWERKRSSGDRGLLIVSTGSVEANRAMGFSSPLVLDQSGEIMNAFGADGTPMAILVDAEGRVASAVASGTEEVLALVSRTVPVPSA